MLPSAGQLRKPPGQAMKRYHEILADYDRAIELDPGLS